MDNRARGDLDKAIDKAITDLLDRRAEARYERIILDFMVAMDVIEEDINKDRANPDDVDAVMPVGQLLALRDALIVKLKKE